MVQFLGSTINPLTGELETIESVLGHPAVSTINAPSNLTRGSGTNLSALASGDFAHIAIQLWGAADVQRNPYQLSAQGVIQYRVYQDVDVAMLYPGASFVIAAMLTT
jgi:hypothetical protein